MALKHKFNEVLRSGRFVPKLLWENIKDIETRLTTAEGKEPEDKLKTVTVNVSMGNGNGSSAADPDMVGATPIGIVSAGNQDQLVDNVEVEGDGKVKVTLAANATVQNNFKVTCLKA